MPPQDAWALVAQALRERRLRELADVVEKAEPGVPVAKVGDWSHADLAANLTHFSMLRRYEPWATADGHWCGDLSVWAYRLYGATAELSFGPETRANVLPVSGTFLGLGVLESVALFEAGASSCAQGEADAEAFRHMLTRETVSEVVRRVAGGVFPALAWESLYQHQGLKGETQFRQEGRRQSGTVP